MATVHHPSHEGHEDLDRAPDGIPHSVVGLTAFYAVVLAFAIVLMLTSERLSLVVMLAVVIPLLVSRLAGKAERERDHLHPSR
jgi:hypothetical protein